MKWLKEVYDLFVDDPILAILSLVALFIAWILTRVDVRTGAGLAIFLIVAASLWYSTRRN